MPTQAIHQDVCRCLEFEMEEFTCANCEKVYGSCYGAADKYPELCDFCVHEIEEDNMIPDGTQKFSLGQVLMTPGVQEVLEKHPEGKGLQELQEIILKRHAHADWGLLEFDEDKHLNDEALETGGRLLSVYYLKDGTERGVKIYVITEAQDDSGVRSATTALLPEEY